MICVARRVRAWIETVRADLIITSSTVARRVRAWIETLNVYELIMNNIVARRVRAWIETKLPTVNTPTVNSRTPCACVD